MQRKLSGSEGQGTGEALIFRRGAGLQNSFSRNLTATFLSPETPPPVPMHRGEGAEHFRHVQLPGGHGAPTPQ